MGRGPGDTRSPADRRPRPPAGPRGEKMRALLALPAVRRGRSPRAPALNLKAVRVLLRSATAWPAAARLAAATRSPRSPNGVRTES